LDVGVPGALVWNAYWNFESYWYLPPRGTLELTPIGIALFASLVPAAMTLEAWGDLKNWVQKLSHAVALITYYGMALILFLYSLAYMTLAFVPPRVPLDFLITALFFVLWIALVTEVIAGLIGPRGQVA
jgi:hypothetical protein